MHRLGAGENARSRDGIAPLPDVTSIFDPTCLELSGQSVIYSNWLQAIPFLVASVIYCHGLLCTYSFYMR